MPTAAPSADVLVVDASVALEALVPGPRSAALHKRLADDDLHAPQLIDLEMVSGLRRLVRAGRLTADRATDALTDLADLRIARYPHQPLIARVWELRDTLTPYDAAYVALAEALEAPLVTGDRALAAAGGHEARIELFDSTD